jgi:hypothetical protein
MTDPERLLKNPPSRLSVLLLRAGAEEKPSAAALRRASRAAVGAALAGAAATSASAASAVAGGATKAVESAAAASGMAAGAANAGAVAAPSTAALGIVAAVKWVGIGAVGGAIAATSAHQLLPRQAAPAPSAAVPAAASNPAPARAASRAPISTPTGALERVPESEASPIAGSRESTSRRAVQPLPASSAPASRVPARADGPVLAAEVLFVDAGRAALQRGASREALALLRGYEAAFPQQQLLTEVLFLRMEAFSRSGNHERARLLAEQIVHRGVTGPQEARAREVLAR